MLENNDLVCINLLPNIEYSSKDVLYDPFIFR